MPSTADTRVDLHFHVLPGVHDGPATLEQSLRIADLAVVTPHVRSDHLLGVDQLHERVRRARGSGAQLTTPPTTTAGDQPHLRPAADRLAHGRPLHRV
jgi:hypothetical protein